MSLQRWSAGARRLTINTALAASILFTTQAAIARQAPPPPAQASSDVDGVITQQMNQAGIVGLGAAIIIDKEQIWSRGYGFADRQRKQPFTPDTVMNVASIAKTIVGAAVMRAVQDGQLSLDADINTYLPFRVVNPHHPAEKITLRHLATHTSSITDRREVYLDTYHYGGDSPVPLGRFLEQYFAHGGEHYSADNFINAKPGARREYSNIGAALAALIVERVTGQPFNVYTREKIFTPLAMTRTGWFLTEIDLANHSTLYIAQNGLVSPIPHYGSTTYPDGGLRTSVADLSKFFIALTSGGEHRGARILDAASAAEMLRMQFTNARHPENLPPATGNSGLFWRTKFNGTRVGHGGSDPGLHTEMLTDHAHNVGVILFVNTSLSGQEQAVIAVIFDALWSHAQTLNRGAAQTTPAAVPNSAPKK